MDTIQKVATAALAKLGAATAQKETEGLQVTMDTLERQCWQSMKKLNRNMTENEHTCDKLIHVVGQHVNKAQGDGAALMVKVIDRLIGDHRLNHKLMAALPEWVTELAPKVPDRKKTNFMKILNVWVKAGVLPGGMAGRPTAKPFVSKTTPPPEKGPESPGDKTMIMIVNPLMANLKVVQESTLDMQHIQIMVLPQVQLNQWQQLMAMVTEKFVNVTDVIFQGPTPITKLDPTDTDSMITDSEADVQKTARVTKELRNLYPKILTWVLSPLPIPDNPKQALSWVKLATQNPNIWVIDILTQKYKKSKSLGESNFRWFWRPQNYGGKYVKEVSTAIAGPLLNRISLLHKKMRSWASRNQIRQTSSLQKNQGHSNHNTPEQNQFRQTSSLQKNPGHSNHNTPNNSTPKVDQHEDTQQAAPRSTMEKTKEDIPVLNALRGPKRTSTGEQR